MRSAELIALIACVALGLLRVGVGGPAVDVVEAAHYHSYSAETDDSSSGKALVWLQLVAPGTHNFTRVSPDLDAAIRLVARGKFGSGKKGLGGSGGGSNKNKSPPPPPPPPARPPPGPPKTDNKLNSKKQPGSPPPPPATPAGPSAGGSFFGKLGNAFSNLGKFPGAVPNTGPPVMPVAPPPSPPPEEPKLETMDGSSGGDEESSEDEAGGDDDGQESSEDGEDSGSSSEDGDSKPAKKNKKGKGKSDSDDSSGSTDEDIGEDDDASAFLTPSLVAPVKPNKAEPKAKLFMSVTCSDTNFLAIGCPDGSKMEITGVTYGTGTFSKKCKGKEERRRMSWRRRSRLRLSKREDDDDDDDQEESGEDDSSAEDGEEEDAPPPAKKGNKGKGKGKKEVKKPSPPKKQSKKQAAKKNNKKKPKEDDEDEEEGSGEDGDGDDDDSEDDSEEEAGAGKEDDKEPDFSVLTSLKSTVPISLEPSCSIGSDEIDVILARVKAACHGYSTCGAAVRELVPSSPTCKGRSAYLSVDYKCTAKPKKNTDNTRVVTICPGPRGMRVDLECPTHKLSIERATYGRHPGTAFACAASKKKGDKVSETVCGRDKNALSGIQAKCQGKKSCTSTFTEAQLGASGLDCPAGPPYLRLWYRCLPEPPPALDASEVSAIVARESNPPKLVGEVTGTRFNPDSSATVDGWACLTGSSLAVTIYVQLGNDASGFLASGPTSIKGSDPGGKIADKCASKNTAAWFSITLNKEAVAKALSSSTGGSAALVIYALDPRLSVVAALSSKKRIQIKEKGVKGDFSTMLEDPNTGLPMGFLDEGALRSSKISYVGWACSRGPAPGVVEVAVYSFASKEGADPKVLQKVKADKPSEAAVHAACGGSAKNKPNGHRFQINVDVTPQLYGRFVGLMALDDRRKRAKDFRLDKAAIAVVAPASAPPPPPPPPPPPSEDCDDKPTEAASLCPRQWDNLFKGNAILNGWIVDVTPPQQSIGNSKALLVPKDSSGKFPIPDFASFKTSEATSTICYTASELSMAQSGFTDVSVSGSYGFVEASVGVSTSSSSQSTSSKSSTSAVANWKLKRVMIALDPKSPSFPFKPNPEFLAAVQAIDGKNIPEADKFIEYKGLTTYWGQVLPLKIELGGKLTTSFKLTQSSQSSASETSLKISAEVGVNLGRLSAKVGVSTGNTQSSAQSSSNYLGSSSWTAVGGATGLVSGAISASGDLSGFGEWARSVDESFKSWAVTARDTFIPIHQLLPDSLQTKVLAWNKAHAARYPPSPPGGFEKWVILTGWCATGYLLGRPTDIRTWENGDGIYNFGKTGSDDECKALCEVDPVCWAFSWVLPGNNEWSQQCTGRAAWVDTSSYQVWNVGSFVQTSESMHISGYKQYRDEFKRINPGDIDPTTGTRAKTHFFRYVFNSAGAKTGPCPCGTCLNLGFMPTFDACQAACLSRNNNGGSIKCKAISWTSNNFQNGMWIGSCNIASCEAVRVDNVYSGDAPTTHGGYPIRYATIPSVADQTAILCEGERTTLTCGQGSVLSIMSVFYGRKPGSVGDKKCGGPGGNCQPDPIGFAVRNNLGYCGGKPSCEVVAGNQPPTNIPDPCQGVLKYLEVTYKCSSAL